MPRLDTTKSLDEQVATFKLQFKLYARYKRDLDDINALIMDPMERYVKIEILRGIVKALGWDGFMWNWDEEWDGELIRSCYQLQDAGFIITQFYRKRKIMMKLPPKTLLKRMEVIQMITNAIGENWSGVSFSKGIQVWWGPIMKGYRY